MINLNTGETTTKNGKTKAGNYHQFHSPYKTVQKYTMGRSNGVNMMNTTLMPKFRCQNWQSAAPPAIVPSIYGLISIIFFTD